MKNRNLNSYFKYISIFLLLIVIFLAFKNFKTSNISDSSVIIGRLKEIKRLEVLQSEIFSYKTYEQSSIFGLNNDSFSVIETGKVIYGVDFDKGLSLNVENKNVKVELPEIEVFDLIVNPGSIDFIGIEKGLFTSQQNFEKIKQTAATDLYNEMKLKAYNYNNIQQAKKSAKLLLISIFKTLGFENIEIEFKKFQIKN